MGKVFVVACVLFVVIPAGVFAGPPAFQYRTIGLYGAFGGVFYSSTDQGFKSIYGEGASNLALGASYAPRQGITAGIQLNRFNDTATLEGVELRINNTSLMLCFRVTPTKPTTHLVPYVGGGVGTSSLNISTTVYGIPYTISVEDIAYQLLIGIIHQGGIFFELALFQGGRNANTGLVFQAGWTITL